MAEAKTIPAQIRSRDVARLNAYRKHLAFFEGDQWPTARTRSTPRRLTFNYTARIIEKVTASVLKGRSFTVTPDGEGSQAVDRAQEAETLIAQVHEQNAIEQLDFDTELDAAVLGDGVYKVLWDADNNMVRITAPDPSGIFAWHWPDDPSRLWRVAHQYQLSTEEARQVGGVTKDELLSQQPSTPTGTTAGHVMLTEVWERETFSLFVNDNLDHEETNALGAIPYVVFPNIRTPKRLWGTSDIPAMKEAQRELNREASQLSGIAELSGNPIAVLENVEEGGDIATLPGAVWELPADAKAYVLDLLQHGALTQHIAYFASIRQAFHDLAEVPRESFGGIDSNISGVALELSLDPLVKKVERKRLIRTEAYQLRTRLILDTLAVFADVDFTDTREQHGVAWGSILPTDRDREVQSALALVAGGVTARRTAADAIGKVADPDAEFARWLEEEAQIDAISDAEVQA